MFRPLPYAIGSWLRAFPGCQILLFGDDPGVAEAAVDLGVEHVPGIECNEFGTPLLSWAFDQAKQRARSDTLGYANADIIFLPGTLERLSQAIRRHCFIVGQRLNIDLRVPLDFASSWDAWLREAVMPSGQLADRCWLDYFILAKADVPDLPAFAVGRPWWDTWFMAYALVRHLPTADASLAVEAIHQNHHYAHIKKSAGPRWEGPEGDLNKALALGPAVHRFGRAEFAIHTLTADGQLRSDYLSQALYEKLVQHERGRLAERFVFGRWARLRLARLLASGWGGQRALVPRPGVLRRRLMRELLLHDAPSLAQLTASCCTRG